MAQLNFNATTVAPQAAFTPIPAGTYTVMVTDSSVNPTKNGTGEIATFTLQVMDGEHRGRKIFARINVRNQNPQAEQIGQSNLSALCHACGVLQMTDTAQVHSKVVRVRVKIRKDETGRYDDQNEVTGFEAVGGQAHQVAPAQAPMHAQAPAANAPAQAASPQMPWKRVAA